MLNGFTNMHVEKLEPVDRQDRLVSIPSMGICAATPAEIDRPGTLGGLSSSICALLWPTIGGRAVVKRWCWGLSTRDSHARKEGLAEDCTGYSFSGRRIATVAGIDRPGTDRSASYKLSSSICRAVARYNGDLYAKREGRDNNRSSG